MEIKKDWNQRNLYNIAQKEKGKYKRENSQHEDQSMKFNRQKNFFNGEEKIIKTTENYQENMNLMIERFHWMLSRIN